ncbi:MAG: hypothetical protein V5A27_07395 [Halapricum sp.]
MSDVATGTDLIWIARGHWEIFIATYLFLGGLIVTAVTIYRCGRTPGDTSPEPWLTSLARTLSCGRPGTDVQQSL